MIWLTLSLLMASVLIFLWHPKIHLLVPRGHKAWVASATILLSLGVYILKGSPDLPDYPFQTLKTITQHNTPLGRQHHTPFFIECVQKNPKDPQKWALLARHFFQMNHYYESALYYREAWQLDPKNLFFKLYYTQSLILLHKGVLSPTTQKLLSELRQEKELPPFGKKLIEAFFP